jgi:hypothetical protein
MHDCDALMLFVVHVISIKYNNDNMVCLNQNGLILGLGMHFLG